MKSIRFPKFLPIIHVGVLTAFLCCSCGGGGGGSTSDGNTSDSKSLEVITPEEAGWSSAALEAVEDVIEQSGYAAVMALYDGKVFFQWGDVTKNYQCHSIRKPFLSALFGIYVQRGSIDLDITLETLAIDDIPPSLTDDEKQATVRHLLKSRSGVYHEAAAEMPETAALRPERGSHPPDTFFYYNNWDFNAAGTIFRQETDEDIFLAFQREIADVVGMQDFSPNNCQYYYEIEKSEHPAYVFRMSARDMARFGVLYQKNGAWEGKQIIPVDWIFDSTVAYSTLDVSAGVGYGYMWYVVPEESDTAELFGYDFYYHTGHGVHALVIVPDLNLVIVERYDTDAPDWEDPGEVGFQIGQMIIDAKL